MVSIISKPPSIELSTYAAVAANISTRLAFVATARHKQNNKVKAQMRPSLALGSVTKERTTIETRGATDDKTVPSIFVTVLTLSLS
jgi:hypothetical protein